MHENETTSDLSVVLDSLRKQDASTEGQHKLWQDLLHIADERQLDVDYHLQYTFHKPALTPEITDYLASWLKGLRKPSTRGRSLEEFAEGFDVPVATMVERLQGKRVLNIGLGKATYPDELHDQYGIDIVSVDNNEDVVRDRKHALHQEATSLQFADESFDEVVASFSLPLWAAHPEEIDKFFDEAIRVTKKGGHINVSPITGITGLPHILKLYKETDLYRHEDNRLAFMHALLQLHVIEKLKRLKEDGIVDISLARPYEENRDWELRDLQKLDPSIAVLTKVA